MENLNAFEREINTIRINTITENSSTIIDLSEYRTNNLNYSNRIFDLVFPAYNDILNLTNLDARLQKIVDLKNIKENIERFFSKENDPIEKLQNEQEIYYYEFQDLVANYCIVNKVDEETEMQIVKITSHVIQDLNDAFCLKDMAINELLDLCNNIDIRITPNLSIELNLTNKKKQLEMTTKFRAWLIVATKDIKKLTKTSMSYPKIEEYFFKDEDDYKKGRFRPYISDSMGTNMTSSKNLFAPKNNSVLIEIFKYCKEHDLEMVDYFVNEYHKISQFQ